MDETKDIMTSAEKSAAEVTAPAASEEKEVCSSEGNASAKNGTEENGAQKNLPTSKTEVIESLKELNKSENNFSRQEVDMLKQAYYRLRNEEVSKARATFIQEGGNPDDFMPAPDPDEAIFKAELEKTKEIRAQLIEKEETEKQENLQKRLAIIEKIKAMTISAEEADKNYNEFKQLQADWKACGIIPAENATETWKNYQLYVELYYDQLHLNYEARQYDFKKNLEIKTHLCEAAEKLSEVEDVVSAFHQLQKLHQEYRETGPVAKELREDIWKRFKDASTAVNKRHQAHFENLKAQEEENLAKKTSICEEIETFNQNAFNSHNEWEKGTEKITALQTAWRSIGFAPKKFNTKIYERFKTACNAFFQAKSAFYKNLRTELSQNQNAKEALAEEAEKLKDSTDWSKVTNQMIDLQKRWKKIGPVPHKVSEELWNRFNEACNFFFEKRNESQQGQRKEEAENLAQKNEVIEELKKLAESTEENVREKLKALQEKWNSIGFVPFRNKDEIYQNYSNIVDKLYDKLHISAHKQNLETFRKAVAEKAGTELSRERQRLQRIFETKKSEIKNYELNLTFITSKSKSGNSLVSDLEKKRERLKRELEEIQEKIKTIREQEKEEKEEKK